MSNPKNKPYNQILAEHPEWEGVISKKSWDFISYADDKTRDLLCEQWIENVERNIRSKRLKRHGGLDRDCIGFGKNKAIIGIGAGRSLNKNKHILKAINDVDGLKHPDDRDFILIASNHMFKPLLKDGIIPDFVFVADASDVVMNQLTVDIPESGRNCILIAGLQCSPRVLKNWEKQGRDIRFYLTSSPGIREKYSEFVDKDPESILIQQGGNVLNSSWSAGLKFFKSSVFMAVGNDLSYELEEDLEKRRNGYYADGDYSSNIEGTGTGRDEARLQQVWMGFSLNKTNIISIDSEELYNIELNPVATTQNLWVYKTWIEGNVLGHANQNKFRYMYYNCTEGGIAGVMCKDDTVKGREDIKNWFMLDSVCKRWRTRKLEDAVKEFLKAKEMLRCPSGLDAQSVIATATRI